MSNQGPRIAIITPYAAPVSVGGVEIFNEQLRQTFPDTDVFTDTGTAALWDWRRLGLDQPRRAVRAVREAVQRHRRDPYDVVVCNGLYGWPLALRGPGVPMVQVYHYTLAGLARNAIDHRGDKFATGTIAAFFDRLSGMGKRVVAVSQNVLSEVQRFYRLKGEVISNGVDTNRFLPGDKARARESFRLPSDAPVGLYVGRPERVKGFDVFLDVVRSMRDVLFLHVGSGSEAREANLRALGRVSHSAMPSVYRAADFYFLPSRYEGFNLSILEALSCGLPIVVSEAAYPFSEGPEKYGKIVRSFAPSEFVRAIREVLSGLHSYQPRPVIEANYSLAAFQARWRDVISRVALRG